MMQHAAAPTGHAFAASRIASTLQASGARGSARAEVEPLFGETNTARSTPTAASVPRPDSGFLLLDLDRRQRVVYCRGNGSVEPG